MHQGLRPLLGGNGNQILQAGLTAGIVKHFYASQAYTYLSKGASGQKKKTLILDLDGLEEFNSELLALQFASRLEVRIARLIPWYGSCCS